MLQGGFLCFRAIMALGLIMPSAVAIAQQECSEIDAVLLACSRVEGIGGTPPLCTCEDVPVESLELTCAANFACPSPSTTATGDWPKCLCPPTVEITTGTTQGDETPDPNLSMGGLGVCSDFFECSGDGILSMIGGQCVCLDAWLPQSRD
jgi:hypothetical protein